VGQKKQLKEFGSQTEQTGRHVSDTRLAAEQKKRAESVSSPKISMTANKVPPTSFWGNGFGHGRIKMNGLTKNGSETDSMCDAEQIFESSVQHPVSSEQRWSQVQAGR
jgi:hypothetical protein